MKKTTILAALFCLFLSAGAAFAQEKAANQPKITNFAGNWELDASKSKLTGRMPVESMTMNVSQTDRELKVESTTMRTAKAEQGDAKGLEVVNGGGRRAMMGGMNGTQTVTYSLDGKETKLETPGIPGADATLQAKFEKDGKLKLTSTRTFNGQMGEMTRTNKETWELLNGGKTLKVTREMDSPGGTQTSEMVFTKKQ